MYDHPAAYRRIRVQVGTGVSQVPAILDLPKGRGPFSAVVLMPGSGPENFNEQILGGPEEPFRDIADGLASAGIAVLRYDKPTYVNPPAFEGPHNVWRVTPKYTDLVDAQSAIRLLLHHTKIAHASVFLLGHSLGGYLAPLIGEQMPRLAGLVMLAAPAQPIVDYLVPQTRYLDSLKGPLTSQERTALQVLTHEVQEAQNPRLKASAPRSTLPFGLPAPYWLFYHRYDALSTVSHLTMPLLILQGGRDYQVPPSNLTQWETALKGHPNATFHLFPQLDHLFVSGKGLSTPETYLQPGHVAPEVVKMIASWIRSHSRR